MSNPPVTSTLQAPASRPREEYQDSDSQATRHLCAGVYIDDRPFRDLVIRQVHNNAQRWVAPSYGFDLVRVVRQAWRSWYLDRGRQVGIIAWLVLCSPAQGGLVVRVDLVHLMLRVAARIIAETFRAQVAAVRTGPSNAIPGRSEDSGVRFLPTYARANSRFCVQLPPEKVLRSDQRGNLISENVTITAMKGQSFVSPQLACSID